MRAQDPYEIGFFTKRLKVKDVMVRNPATVDADDTMENCLFRGQNDRMSQFPVLDQGKVVGILSANEVFHLAARILGAWENWSGITLIADTKARGDLSRIAAIADNGGAVLASLYAVGSTNEAERKIIVRFTECDAEAMAQAYRDAGYTVAEVSANVSKSREKKTA
jgi:acetoin utilization protein AcuB